MFLPNLKSIASPVAEIVIGVLGGGCEPPILRKRRSGMVVVPFERALASSYRPSVVTFLLGTFRLSLRISEICRFCAPARHFPAPLLISSKFSRVSLGVGG